MKFKNLKINKRVASLLTAFVLSLTPVASQAITCDEGFVKSGSILTMRFNESETSEQIGSVPAGKTMERIYLGDYGYDLVEYDGRLGFVHSRYINYEAKQPNALHFNYLNMEVQCSENTNLLLNCLDYAEVICNVEKGRHMKVLAEVDSYYYLVQFEGVLGFIRKNYVTTNFFKQETISEINFTIPYVNEDSILTLRTAPDKNAKKIDSIKVGTELHIYSYSNGWYYIYYNGNFGYVCADYVKQNGHMTHYLKYQEGYQGTPVIPVTPKPTETPVIEPGPIYGYMPDMFDYIGNTSNLYVDAVKCNSSSVNIRKGPSADTEKLGYLVRNEKLEFTGNVYNNFYEVIYLNQIAYVSCGYSEIDQMINKYYDGYYRLCYANAVLDVRYNPTLEKKDISGNEIDKYEVMKVIWENDDFVYVVTNEYVGYVRKKYTKDLSGVFMVTDLSEQRVTVYQDRDILFQAPITSGNYNTPTNKGIFKTYQVDYYDYVYDHENPSYSSIIIRDTSGNVFYVNKDQSTYRYGTHYYYEDGGFGNIAMKPSDIELLNYYAKQKILSIKQK